MTLTETMDHLGETSRAGRARPSGSTPEMATSAVAALWTSSRKGDLMTFARRSSDWSAKLGDRRNVLHRVGPVASARGRMLPP